MGAQDLQPADIRIVERRKRSHDEPPGIIPNDVLINGQSVAMMSNRPVKVHEIEQYGNSLVEVTLTLVARRVAFEVEYED